MKKILALILSVLMLVCAFAACKDAAPVQPGESAGEPEKSADEPEKSISEPIEESDIVPYGRFRTYLSAAPTTLNTYVDAKSDSAQVADYCSAFIYGVRPDAEGLKREWFCDLASDFPKQTDDEGLVWQFTLNKKAKWANGDPITAEDVLYSFKMLFDPFQVNLSAHNLVNNSYVTVSGLKEYYQGVSEWEEVGVRKLDDYTVELTAEYPTSEVNVINFLSKIYLCYKPFYDAGMSMDGTYTDYGSSVELYMSSGPFVLTEWIPDEKLTLERNPNYLHRDLIHIEGIDISIVSDAKEAIKLFKQGDLDMCSISYGDWAQFEGDNRAHEYFNDSLMHFTVNTGNPNQNNLLGKINFRKALFYGADRASLGDVIGTYPATRIIRHSIIGVPADGTPFIDLPQDYVVDPDKAFNPSLANEYLSKAFEECNLASATMAILHSETATHLKTAAQFLQKQYPEVFKGDLNITLQIVPSSQVSSIRRWNPSNPASFDTAVGSILPSATDCRDTFRYYISTFSPPRSDWTNPEFDAMYNKAIDYDLVRDNEKIIELCQKMEKMLLDDMVVVPLYEKPEKVFYSDNIKLPTQQYITGYGFGEKYMIIEQ